MAVTLASVLTVTCRPRLSLVAAATIVALLAPAMPAAAGNDALLKLLRILRDRGSISADEYEELRLAASADEAEEPSNGGGAPLRAAVAHDSAPAVAPALPASVDGATSHGAAPPPQAAQREAEVRAAPPSRWYDRIGLRGYTQFRLEKAGTSTTGTAVEVPADRFVNANETFGIRRGRFIFSGDVTDRVYLYAQSDFSASTGAPDFSLQMRDLYADIALDADKAFRVRLGQSKVPYGWVNMQSSQNRAALERPDALNSAVEGERDLGAYLMWASPEARRRFRDLVGQGLKGSGDYGVVAVGAYSGQGLNRSDQNGNVHWLARAAYPFRLPSGQYFELGIQGYRGRFVSPAQALTVDGQSFTPTRDADGVMDERIAATAVWYPQPIGVEAEWTVGRGPQLDEDFRQVSARRLHGGYVQVGYRRAEGEAALFPFVRWQYYDGGRKFARNAPRMRVNEIDLGIEVARWAEVELAMIYTRTLTRTRSSLFPYGEARGVNRLGVQVQWNY